MGMQSFYEKSGIYGVAPTESNRLFVTAQHRLDRTLQLVQAMAPRRVLDIGCGDGFFSQRIAQATAAQVSAVDISFEAIERARARGIDAWQCDLNMAALPFDAERFDLVVCAEVIEHVLDAQPGGLVQSSAAAAGSAAHL
jgi:2-polyprenyl-3-methyl-5-hydroxy-6-metoxy-1,4-benzoquinol methylase